MTAYTPVAATMRRQLRYGVTAGNASFPATTRLALESCDITARRSLIAPDDEMRGQFAHAAEPVTQGNYPVGGTCTLTPRPNELDVLLPLIFGGTWATNTLDPDVLLPFGFSFDRAVNLYNYSGMKVASATFSSTAGQQVKLQMQLEGTSEAITTSGSFPSLNLSVLQPYVHYHCALGFQLGSYTQRYVNNVQIQVNNGLDLNRFMNSQYRTEVPQGERTVTLSCDNPFTSAEADLLHVVNTAAGITGSITWTNGSYALTFSFPSLHVAPVAPPAPGKGAEMTLRLQFQARQKYGDPIPQEIQITRVKP